MHECYAREPLDYEDGIPIFSLTDFYVENYERISIDHLNHFETTGNNPWIREDHWQEIESSTEALIKKYATKSDIKILDVGVGMGRLLGRIPELQRFGMDISKGYLKHAKAKGIEVCMARIEDIPYREQFFDMVVATDVLEHVLDLNLVVRKILSVIKVGGIVIVRVPYKEDLHCYLEPNYPYDLVHLRNFEENGLRILFEKIFNMQVLEWSLTGFNGGRLRVGSNIRYYGGAVRRILNISNRLNKGVYRFLRKRIYQPTEMNMVIRNSQRVFA